MANRYQNPSKKRFWAIIGTIVVIGYIVWRILFTFPYMEAAGWLAFACAIVYLLIEVYMLFDNGGIVRAMRHAPIPKHPQLPDELYPDVDVFVDVKGAPLDAVYKTVTACKRMKYPEGASVSIYICDDTENLEVASLADRCNVGYVGGSNLVEGCPLNAALAVSQAPWVAVFSCDVIPDGSFLMDSIPYTYMSQMKQLSRGQWILMDDLIEEGAPTTVGFVQTPQTLYNPDLYLFESNSDEHAANSMDYLDQIPTSSKNRNNTALLTGKADIVSRDALYKIGGFALRKNHDSRLVGQESGEPVEHVADFLSTGVKIAEQGFRNYSIDKELSNGYAPRDFVEFVRRNLRDLRMVRSSFKRTHACSSPDLGLGTRISFMSERSNWAKSIVFLAAFIIPILFVLFCVPVYICSMADLLLICFVVYLVYTYASSVVSAGNSANSLSHVFGLVMLPFVMFKPKGAKEIESLAHKAMVFYIALLVIDGIGVIAAILEFVFLRYWGVFAIVYWMLMNASYLAMAAMFLKARKNSRASIRLPLHVKAVISCQGSNGVFTGKTRDISETGLSVELPYPLYVADDDSLVDVLLKDEKHEVRLTARLVHVRQEGSNWIYGMSIAAIDLYDSEQLSQMLFDFANRGKRTDGQNEPGMLEQMTSKYRKDKKSRKHSSGPSRRKRPRIPIDREFEDINGDSWFVVNCNYEYVLMKPKEGKRLPAQLFLRIPGADFIMDCRESATRPNLYEVANYKDLNRRGAFEALAALQQ